MRDEIIENIRATFKETDIYKLFQTGDLANLEALEPDQAALVPELMALKKVSHISTGFLPFFFVLRMFKTDMSISGIPQFPLVSRFGRTCRPCTRMSSATT